MKRLIFLGIVVASLLFPTGEAEAKKQDIEVTGAPEEASLKEALSLFREQWKEENSQGQDAAYLRSQAVQGLVKILHAHGYYDAEVYPPAESSKKEKKVKYRVESGAQYRFGDVEVMLDGAGASEISERDVRTALKKDVQPGAPALAGQVFLGQDAVVEALEKAHCFFDLKVSHRALIDRDSKKLDLEFDVVAGAKARFGDVSLTGLETVKESYVRKVIPIKKGECFRRAALNDTRFKLQQLGLFGLVGVELPEAPNAEGEADIIFNLTERAHRTIKAGTSFSTDVGPGVTAGWEHRNFFSSGEKLTADLSLNAIERRLDGKLEKPYFMRDDQKLKLFGEIEEEDSDAYQTKGFSVGAQLERELWSKWKGATGVSYGVQQIQDQQSTENFALFSFPSYLSKDARDNVLDPTKGWTFKVDGIPFIDTLSTGTAFFKSRVSGSYFLGAQSWPGKPVLALRAATGSITGVTTSGVPATERFFTGGGGSVRGYGYQELGPLDAENNPLGGRSFVESSIELRLRVTETLGLVTFFDTGNTFDAAFADFDEGLRHGAGLGFRYFTGFGPLRADFAVPLDTRPGIDDSFQFYFSIGQAF